MRYSLILVSYWMILAGFAVLSSRICAQGQPYSFVPEVNKFDLGGARTVVATLLDSAGNESSAFTTTITKLDDMHFRLTGQVTYLDGWERHFTDYTFNQQRQLIFWKDSFVVYLSDSQGGHTCHENYFGSIYSRSARGLNTGDTAYQEGRILSDCNDYLLEDGTYAGPIIITHYNPSMATVETEWGVAGLEGTFRIVNSAVPGAFIGSHHVRDSHDAEGRILRRLHYFSPKDTIPNTVEMRWYEGDTVSQEFREIRNDGCIFSLTRIKRLRGVVIASLLWSDYAGTYEDRATLNHKGLPIEKSRYRNGVFIGVSHRYAYTY